MLTIEHNLDVVKTADYVIDLGPEGGDRGGTIVGDRDARGGRRKSPSSFTGEYLAPCSPTSARTGITSMRRPSPRAKQANLKSLDDLIAASRVPVEAVA